MDTRETAQELMQKFAKDTGIVRHLPLASGDPLGIGGLLFDAHRIAGLTIRGIPFYPGVLGSVASAALRGPALFARSQCLDLPAEYRLAFRELGLSAGLAAVSDLRAMVSENIPLSGEVGDLLATVDAPRKFFPLRSRIESFWMTDWNRASAPWSGHRDINTVMLATSISPQGFLGTAP